MNGWSQNQGVTWNAAAQAPVADRSAFLVKTYAHLFAAFTAFLALSALWWMTPVAPALINLVFVNRLGMIVFMLAFVGVGMLANKWALGTASPAMQYAGLGLYVLFESILFVPLFGMALSVTATTDPLVLPKALGITFVLFGMMSAVVFLTRKDFSWMRGVLFFGAIGMLLFAVAGLIFGFTMPLAFMWFGVVLACGYLLYDTSNVMLHYRTDQHVAASLALFASLAMLLWYVLRILLASSRRN